MARRRKPRPSGLPLPGLRRWGWRTRVALLLNLAILLSGGIWYALQPPCRHEAVRILLGNTLQR